MMEKFTEFSWKMTKIFFAAVETGDLETVLMFLEAGINPNVLYRDWTPLRRAVYYNQLGIAHLLLDVGADPNFKNSFSRTPLWYIVSDNSKMAKLLLAYSANFDIQDIYLETPLHWYVRVEQPKVVEMLLLAGANPNVKKKYGKTPLDEAREHAHISSVLRKYGAE